MCMCMCAMSVGGLKGVREWATFGHTGEILVAREISASLEFHFIFNQAVQCSKRAKTVINRDTHCQPGCGCPTAGTKKQKKQERQLCFFHDFLFYFTSQNKLT